MKFPNVVLPGRRRDAVRGRRRGPRAVDGQLAGSRAGFATPGPARSSSKAFTPATMRAAPSTWEPTPSSCPITAAGSSMACRPRCASCPKWWPRSADQIEVLLDGGIRRGSDIAKALCLGARAVLVGRAYAYGLGAAGGAGVTRAIEILRTDLVRTMKLLGCASVAELDSIVCRCSGRLADHVPASPTGRTLGPRVLGRRRMRIVLDAASM